jgi:8-amino-7-oxononanoate synthase
MHRIQRPALTVLLCKQAQERIQINVKYFFRQMTTDPVWEDALDVGLLSCPLTEDWEQRPYHSHIVPIRTRPRHEQCLFLRKGHVASYTR